MGGLGRWAGRRRSGGALPVSYPAAWFPTRVVALTEGVPHEGVNVARDFRARPGTTYRLPAGFTLPAGYAWYPGIAVLSAPTAAAALPVQVPVEAVDPDGRVATIPYSFEFPDAKPRFIGAPLTRITLVVGQAWAGIDFAPLFAGSRPMTFAAVQSVALPAGLAFTGSRLDDVADAGPSAATSGPVIVRVRATNGFGVDDVAFEVVVEAAAGQLPTITRGQTVAAPSGVVEGASVTRTQGAEFSSAATMTFARDWITLPGTYTWINDVLAANPLADVTTDARWQPADVQVIPGSDVNSAAAATLPAGSATRLAARRVRATNSFGTRTSISPTLGPIAAAVVAPSGPATLTVPDLTVGVDFAVDVTAGIAGTRPYSVYTDDPMPPGLRFVAVADPAGDRVELRGPPQAAAASVTLDIQIENTGASGGGIHVRTATFAILAAPVTNWIDVVKGLRNQSTPNGRMTAAALKVPGVDPWPITSGITRSGTSIIISSSPGTLQNWDLRGYNVAVRTTVNFEDCLFGEQTVLGLDCYLDLYVDADVSLKRCTFEGPYAFGGADPCIKRRTSGTGTAVQAGTLRLMEEVRFVGCAGDHVKSAGRNPAGRETYRRCYFGPARNLSMIPTTYAAGTNYAASHLVRSAQGHVWEAKVAGAHPAPPTTKTGGWTYWENVAVPTPAPAAYVSGTAYATNDVVLSAQGHAWRARQAGKLIAPPTTATGSWDQWRNLDPHADPITVITSIDGLLVEECLFDHTNIVPGTSTELAQTGVNNWARVSRDTGSDLVVNGVEFRRIVAYHTQAEGSLPIQVATGGQPNFNGPIVFDQIRMQPNAGGNAFHDTTNNLVQTWNDVRHVLTDAVIPGPAGSTGSGTPTPTGAITSFAEIARDALLPATAPYIFHGGLVVGDVGTEIEFGPIVGTPGAVVEIAFDDLDYGGLYSVGPSVLGTIPAGGVLTAYKKVNRQPCRYQAAVRVQGTTAWVAQAKPFAVGFAIDWQSQSEGFYAFRRTEQNASQAQVVEYPGRLIVWYMNPSATDHVVLAPIHCEVVGVGSTLHQLTHMANQWTDYRNENGHPFYCKVVAHSEIGTGQQDLMDDSTVRRRWVEDDMRLHDAAYSGRCRGVRERDVADLVMMYWTSSTAGRKPEDYGENMLRCIAGKLADGSTIALGTTLDWNGSSTTIDAHRMDHNWSEVYAADHPTVMTWPRTRWGMSGMMGLTHEGYHRNENETMRGARTDARATMVLNKAGPLPRYHPMMFGTQKASDNSWYNSSHPGMGPQLGIGGARMARTIAFQAMNLLGLLRAPDGALPPFAGYIDQIDRQPSRIRLRSSIGPLLTDRSAAGQAPYYPNHQAWGVTVDGVHARTEIRDAAGNLAAKGDVWVLPPSGQSWTGAEVVDWSTVAHPAVSGSDERYESMVWRDVLLVEHPAVPYKAGARFPGLPIDFLASAAEIAAAPRAAIPPAPPAPDTIAPILSSPTDAANGATGGTGTVSTDEAGGTLYVAATAGLNSAAPSQAQMEAGTGGGIVAANSAAVAAAGARTLGVTGLTPNTTYRLHFMQKDGASPPNYSAIVSGNGFTTDVAASGISLVGYAGGASPVSLTSLASGSGGAAAESDVVFGARLTASAADRALSFTTTGYATIVDLAPNDTHRANLLGGHKRMGATPDTALEMATAAAGATDVHRTLAVALRGVHATTTLDVPAVSASGTNGTSANLPASQPPTVAGCVALVIVAAAYLDTSTNSPYEFVAPVGEGWVKIGAATSKNSTRAATLMAFLKTDLPVGTAVDPGTFTLATTGDVTGDSWAASLSILRPA